MKIYLDGKELRHFNYQYMYMVAIVQSIAYKIVLFVLLLYVPFNSYGHGRMVSSPNHTFFLGKLEQTVNQYFVHILSLVTDKKSFLNDSAEGRRMTIENIS